jgi:hypothetical protein
VGYARAKPCPLARGDPRRPPISARRRAQYGRKQGDQPERGWGKISNENRCGGLATRAAIGSGVARGAPLGERGSPGRIRNPGWCQQELVVDPGQDTRRAREGRVKHGVSNMHGASATRETCLSSLLGVWTPCPSLRCALPVELNADFPLASLKNPRACGPCLFDFTLVDATK